MPSAKFYTWLKQYRILIVEVFQANTENRCIFLVFVFLVVEKCETARFLLNNLCSNNVLVQFSAEGVASPKSSSPDKPDSENPPEVKPTANHLRNEASVLERKDQI